MWINLISALLTVFILSCSDKQEMGGDEVKRDSLSVQQRRQRFIKSYSDSTPLIRKRLTEFSFLLKDGTMLTTADWTPRGGIWDFSDSIYYGQGTQANNKAYYNRKVLSDFIFEVKMNKLTEDGSFGLIFRYDECTDNGYILEIYPHGDFLFCSHYFGMRKILINEPIKKFKRAVQAWNKVKVVGKGNTFSVFINDYLITLLRDNRFTIGRIGFYIDGGPRQQARFRVVQIKELK